MVELILRYIYIAVLVLLGIGLFACLIRAIRGPRIADRLIAVNMSTTMVIVMIGVLSLLLNESYLLDICLIYAMVSFLGVIIVTFIYMSVYRQKWIEEEGVIRRGMD